MRRRLVPAFLAAVGFAAVSIPAPATAQYMYLDSNGDGVHDDADSLSAYETNVADLWLVTDRMRQGNAVLCLMDRDATMDLNYFEVILRAEGGLVRYGSLEPLEPSMTFQLGTARDTSEFVGGFASQVFLPPGRYRLARIEIDVLRGSPSIRIAPETSLGSWHWTAFGSTCLGKDFDNTLKLGLDWFDADGLRASGEPPGSRAGAPAFEPMDIIEVSEGETAERRIVAMDSDSDTLRLEVLEAPPYATVGEPIHTPGRVDAPLRVAPGYRDAGASRILLEASDGTSRALGALFISVVNVNHAPAFDSIPDLEIVYGVVTSQSVMVRDADLEPLAIQLREGPAFATLEQGPTGPGFYSGTLRLVPRETDPGRWTIVLAASDRIDEELKAFDVTVAATSPYVAPVIDSIPDLVVKEGSNTIRTIRATDPDLGSIEFSLSDHPYFVYVDRWGRSSEPGVYETWLSVWTHRVPLGEWRPTITASDGVLSSARSFRLAVADSEFAPEIRANDWWCAGQGDVRTYAVRVVDLDGNLASVSYGPTPSWGTALDVSAFERHYTFAPTSDDSIQEFPIEIVATDFGGLETRETHTAAVTAPGTCISSGPFEGEQDNGPPVVPEAGGPYAGVAGAAIRLDGSLTQNGTGRQFRWSFGDGATGLGRAMAHRYQDGGTYRAVLCVFDAHDSTTVCDSTLVVIRDALPARAFQAPEETPIVLRSERSRIVLRLERVGGEYALEELVAGSFCLSSPGHGEVESILAQGSKGARIEDRDRNGAPERTVEFSIADLRRLFAGLRGKRSVPARLEARRQDGARVRASLALSVLGSPARPVTVSPNPMNPRGTISFELRTAGRATVRLYDVSGRLVRTLLDRRAEPGEIVVTMDGRDGDGRSMASGVYFYEVRTDEGEWRGRVTILK